MITVYGQIYDYRVHTFDKEYRLTCDSRIRRPAKGWILLEQAGDEWDFCRLLRVEHVEMYSNWHSPELNNRQLYRLKV